MFSLKSLSSRNRRHTQNQGNYFLQECLHGKVTPKALASCALLESFLSSVN